MKGMGTSRIKLASMFIVAALSATMARASERQARARMNIDPARGHLIKGEPSNGAFNYRGGPGTKRMQRAAAKHRNVLRNRAAHRSARA